MFDHPEMRRESGAHKPAGHSLIHEVIDHTKTTWSHVLHGKASAREYLEAGAEVLAGVCVAEAVWREISLAGETRIVAMKAGEKLAESAGSKAAATKAIETGSSVAFRTGETIPDV